MRLIVAGLALERAGRTVDDFDIGDSLLGAIAPDAETARRAGRVLAAFYIPSMPPALLERHAIDPDEVKSINDAFAGGDVRLALDRTPDEIADRLVLAGTPEDWIEWLTDVYEPAGLNHALVSFADPFTLESWAGIRIEGLPSLCDQVRLVGEAVLPSIAHL